MKKILFASLVLLAGCAQTTTVDSNASAQTRMRACMTTEATNRLQAGTLFVNSLSVTSEDIVNTCLRKLALQAAGISEESQSAAENIINSFKSLTGN